MRSPTSPTPRRRRTGCALRTETTFVALLRAVNVGGTGALPMRDLQALCVAAGFGSVRTYIASGNVLFTSALAEAQVQALLATALHEYAGRPVGVLVRSAGEMAGVLAGNPFPHAAPNRTVAIFLDQAPPRDALAEARGRVDEEIAIGRREIYVHYPRGIGPSKLRIPAAQAGTARNLNTVAKLVELAAGRRSG